MKYHARFWPVFLVNAIILVSLIVFVVAISLFFQPYPHWICVMPLAFPLAAIFSLDRNFQYPIRICPAVLDGYDLVGYAVSIGWEGVRKVRRASLCGLPYLRITSQAHGDELWLPLLLKNFDDFAEHVAEYAGGDNPITAALNEYRWEAEEAS